MCVSLLWVSFSSFKVKLLEIKVMLSILPNMDCGALKSRHSVARIQTYYTSCFGDPGHTFLLLSSQTVDSTAYILVNVIKDHIARWIIRYPR